MTITTAAALERTVVTSLLEADWTLGPQGQWVAHLLHRGNTPGCHGSLRGILMPPGHVAGAHRHSGHEVQVLVLHGYAASLVGDSLYPVLHGAGEPIRLAADDTHAAVNLTDGWLLAVEAFSDPHSVDVQLLPGLDDDVTRIGSQLRGEHIPPAAPRWESTDDVLGELLARHVIPTSRSRR